MQKLTAAKRSAKWHMAKKRGYGLQLTIELYVPVFGYKTKKMEAKHKVNQQIRPILLKLTETVEQLQGVIRIYEDT